MLGWLLTHFLGLRFGPPGDNMIFCSGFVFRVKGGASLVLLLSARLDYFGGEGGCQHKK